ncbi:hypothetical protein [Mycobacterium sp. 1081908.1]|uniref:hypothetical protein n=1 Tax=Mycobacterium sp. 1081908.1 TaxID=1834066 RepID=UPI0012E9CB55|nr:hypothetical protein [Mycobacterium sp. 1081908.1]
MTIRVGRAAAAVCGGAALVLAAGLGVTGADESRGGATAPPSSVAPTGGGAISVRPAGGGACIVGLNCGCIPHRTCPTPHPRPGTAGANQHNAPAPQNP